MDHASVNLHPKPHKGVKGNIIVINPIYKPQIGECEFALVEGHVPCMVKVMSKFKGVDIDPGYFYINPKYFDLKIKDTVELMPGETRDEVKISYPKLLISFMRSVSTDVIRETSDDVKTFLQKRSYPIRYCT